MGGPRAARREHSGLARRADRREQRRRVGRDRQQRRSERLGRRRGRSRRSDIAIARPTATSRSSRRSAEIAVAGGAPVRIETRVDALGPRRRRGLARPAARAARDLARAAGARPRHRRPRRRRRRRERERDPRALGGPVAELGAGRRGGEIAWVVNGPLPRRVGFDGSRPESLADGSRSWQGRLRAAGRDRRPRRRAVHGQQPHAAAEPSRRREPHVDAAAAREAHRRFARGAPHVRRARLPRDAARHARRRLRADPRDDSRRRRAPTNASRCCSERAR